jgi:LPS-assembly protein
MKRKFITFFLCAVTLQSNAFAVLKGSFSDRELQDTILKADSIEGDRDTNIVTAIGNVEAKNGITTATSNKMSYDRNAGIIKASGDVKVVDKEFGKIYTQEAQIKDDFTTAEFPQSLVVFEDGSYLSSKKTTKKDENTVILKNPTFSICPNDKIAKDNSKATKSADFISIKSSKTTIDQEKQIIKTNHGILRVYNIPIFYTPYFSFPTKKNKRKSGFLTPSYVNNSQFGIGFNIPYFFAVKPNIDLVTTPRFYKNNDQFLLNNKIHQLTKYGEHNTEIEISNNKLEKINDVNVVDRTDKKYRYDFRSNGEYIFTTNSSLKHKIHTIGDRNYLRDFNFDFRAFTSSEISYDYVNKRDFLNIKTVRFQELETASNPDEAQFVLPSITHYAQSEKSLFYKEKYGIETNFNYITRDSGLQYRRLSTTPEVKIPFNFHGNLIDLKAKFELDYYSLDTSKGSENYQDYSSSIFNYKPEFIATWHLPLIQKREKNTFMFEPIASFTSSTFKKNFTDLPNEDSNNSELTVNNLYVADRIAGYDRNEAGERISYGARSSMYNDYGQFEFSLGQSYRLSNRQQDVAIRGFNDNNKSNIVGQFSYKMPEYFDAVYLFQLNESDYNNEVNSLITNLKLSKLSISNDYLLLRKGIINNEKIEQDTITVGYRFTPKFKMSASVTKNLVTSQNLTRSATIEYDGCCAALKFITTENSTSNLLKTQRSYSINVVIKAFSL